MVDTLAYLPLNTVVNVPLFHRGSYPSSLSCSNGKMMIGIYSALAFRDSARSPLTLYNLLNKTADNLQSWPLSNQSAVSTRVYTAQNRAVQRNFVIHSSVIINTTLYKIVVFKSYQTTVQSSGQRRWLEITSRYLWSLVQVFPQFINYRACDFPRLIRSQHQPGLQIPLLFVFCES